MHHSTGEGCTVKSGPNRRCVKNNCRPQPKNICSGFSVCLHVYLLNHRSEQAQFWGQDIPSTITKKKSHTKCGMQLWAVMVGWFWGHLDFQNMLYLSIVWYHRTHVAKCMGLKLIQREGGGGGSPSWRYLCSTFHDYIKNMSMHVANCLPSSTFTCRAAISSFFL